MTASDIIFRLTDAIDKTGITVNRVDKWSTLIQNAKRMNNDSI